MALTWTTLKAKIADWLNNESAELEAALPDIVRLAERKIAREADLRAFRARDTLPAAAAEVALPNDCLVVRTIRHPTGDYLLPRTDVFIREYWPDPAATGTPRYYAHKDDVTLLLAPTPAAATDLEILYTVDPEGLSDTNTTTWLSTNAEDVLLFACLIEAATYLEGLTEAQLALYAARYTEAMQRLSATEARNLAGAY